MTDPQGQPVLSEVSPGPPPGPPPPLRPPLTLPARPQVIPVSSVTRQLRGEAGGAARELLFPASVPALGFATFAVSRQSHRDPPAPPAWRPTPAPPQEIQNEVPGGHDPLVLGTMGTWFGGWGWSLVGGIHPHRGAVSVGPVKPVPGQWEESGGGCRMGAGQMLDPPPPPQHVRVLLDPLTGHLKEIQNLDKGIALPIFQSFYW